MVLLNARLRLVVPGIVVAVGLALVVVMSMPFLES
jgi:hypothetical protein